SSAITASPISFAVRSASVTSGSQIATLAPEATNRSVMARPNPWAPPVTTAQRPLRSILFMVETFGRMASEHISAIDNEIDAGGESTFVAAEIHRHMSDFFRGA